MYRNPRLVKWLDEEGMADDFLRDIDWANLDWRVKSQEDCEQIEGYFARFFKSKTTAELLEGAIPRRIELHPMSTPKEVLSLTQLKDRGYWQEVKHDDLGITLTYPSSLWKASETSVKIWRRAPLIGEHNQEIYEKELGFSREDLIALKQGRII